MTQPGQVAPPAGSSTFGSRPERPTPTARFMLSLTQYLTAVSTQYSPPKAVCHVLSRIGPPKQLLFCVNALKPAAKPCASYVNLPWLPGAARNGPRSNTKSPVVLPTNVAPVYGSLPNR